MIRLFAVKKNQTHLATRQHGKKNGKQKQITMQRRTETCIVKWWVQQVKVQLKM